MFTGSFFCFGEHALILAVLKGNTNTLGVNFLQCSMTELAVNTVRKACKGSWSAEACLSLEGLRKKGRAQNANESSARGHNGGTLHARQAVHVCQ